MGPSVEDGIYKSRWGMTAHAALLRERGRPEAPTGLGPEIVVRQARSAAVAWHQPR